MSSDNILHGSVGQLPSPLPTAIRVFFSSTFTDMTEERNMLMTEAVPELRAYCNKKGFDFEVVDMRWGVNEDASNDHSTVDICLKEIENCQQTSLGPNFVLFVGDKYGSRLLPSSIPVTEFRLFRRIASWMHLKFDTVEKWYLLNTNCVPHVYQIQPITSLLPYYNNLNPVNATKRLMHQQNWESDERNIRKVFRKVSLAALEHKKITETDCAKYFISITENEIYKGIFTYPKIKDRVIYFERSLININTEDKMAKRFIDLTSEGEIDEEARDLRKKLCNESLPQHVPEHQTVKNSVSWTPKGIDPDDDEHGRYLTMLCEAFKTLMTQQIDKSVACALEAKISNALISEIMSHMHFGMSKHDCFYGQAEFINCLYDMMHIETDDGEQPKSTSPHIEANEKKSPAAEEHGEQGVMEENREENAEDKGADNIEEPSSDTNEDNDMDHDESARKNGDETARDEDDNENDDNENNEDNNDEENDPNQAKKNEIEAMRQAYKQMGDKAPTFGMEDLDYDTTSDPTRNAKDDLLLFKCTEKIKCPVVMYGESGSGKTAIMAGVAHSVKTWHPDAVVVIRFLGTTSQSSSIRGILTSLIMQIWAAYKVSRPTDMDFCADVIYLGQYLQALIWKVASAERPLYILLDSLDQMTSAEQAHGLAWLPTSLPVHCCMLVSTLPNECGCLDSARRVLQSESQFVEVPALRKEDADKIIGAVCNHNGRALTRPQRNFLLERFQECPNPLYLKLIIDRSLSWRSHQQVKDLILGSDTHHAINHMLMDLERNHGITLVSKAFGYMTAMKRGVSSLEMEDILSLDNEVLHDTYLYHLPPSADVIRLPPSLWARIVMDAKDYLAGEEIGGRKILSWFHRLFAEVARERYITEEVRLSLHCSAARYFLGYWHNKVKPLRLFKGKTGWYPDNTRGVPDQPLVNKDGSFNIRKLSELPHHLAHAGMWKEFHKEIICNIEWLVAKVKACGFTDLKADLMLMLKQRNSLSEEVVEEPEDQPPEEDKEEKKESKEGEDNEIKEGDKGRIEGDEDLFITENKKDDVGKTESSGEKNEEEENNTEKTWVTPEPEYVPDLSTAMRDLELLIDIVTLGSDCVRQNAYNLPVQIICQLGKNRAVSPGLKKLVADSYNWIEENGLPMFMPHDACMPPPGEMLQTSLNVDVHLLGADRIHDYPVVLSKENNYLYAVQQRSQKQDCLIVLDLHAGGERVMVEDMKCYAHSIRLNPSERFLIVSVYQELSPYQPVFHYRLYERGQVSQYKLEKEAKHMDVSRDGDIVAYADDHICYICSPKREELTLEIVYRLHHQELITNIIFSLDAYYLLTFMPGDGFKVWVPRRGESTVCVDSKKTNRFSLQETSGKHVHITSSHHLLQVLSGHNERNTLRICDLSNGDVLYELQSPELSYGIDHLELDEEEEYVLVSTEEGSVLNGNRSKSVLLWDIESGKLISRVTSDRPFAATKLFVSDKIIYILAAHTKDPTISVYSAGPKHRPLAGAKLIRQINGHTRDILQILLVRSDNQDAGGDRMLSVSADNSVKIWDFKQVLKPPSKTKQVDIGSSVDLVYTKEGDAIYFATDKGYIIRQCASTGEKSTLASELDGPVHIMLVSKNGRLLIAAVNNMIYVYYIETGELEFTLESCANSRISCMAENSNVLIAGHAGMEGKGRLWDLSSGRTLKDVSFLYSFYKTAVNSRGTQFGVTMFEYPLMMNVFDMGEEERNISMEQVDTMMSACSHLEFSPDTKMLVSTSSDGRIRIIDTETGRYLHTMVQRSSISTLLFSWDSRYLLTAGYRAVYIWNIGPEHPPDLQGQLDVKLSRHTNFVTCMQLVLDDRFLVTASLDKTIALWSMKTRTTLCSFYYHCSIDVMAVAPDLSTVAFMPKRSPMIGVLTLNKSGKEALKGIASIPVPPKVRRAQAVALSFSSQQVTQKTSTACSIL